MTRAAALADCVLSGQVPRERVPGLVAETPGLEAELERRSRARSPALAGQTGRDAPATIGSRPVDSLDLISNAPLGHCHVFEESRRPRKTGGFLSQLLRSFHLPSVLRRKHGADG